MQLESTLTCPLCGYHISTLLAVLAGVVVATALIGWFSMHHFSNADSEIFNKFGPVSGAEGVPCAIMTSCPPDSSR